MNIRGETLSVRSLDGLGRGWSGESQRGKEARNEDGKEGSTHSSKGRTREVCTVYGVSDTRIIERSVADRIF